MLDVFGSKDWKMAGSITSRATDRVRKTKTLEPDLVSVQLSPEMTRKLAKVEEAVHDSEHFSPDILENLQGYASGKPFSSIGMAFTGLAYITQETMRHVNATGDQHAEDALADFLGEFHENRGTPPFTLTMGRSPNR